MIVSALLLAASACGSSGSARGDDTAQTRIVDHARGTTEVPASPRNLSVLGEEFLLADVLALGVVPGSSTTTLDAASGLDAYDVSSIVALSATEPNIEQLAALEPDMILAPAFVTDAVGYETLDAVAPTIAIPAGDWREQLTFVAAALGAETRADDLLADYDEAVAGARERVLEGAASRPVSMATIYPGPQLAFWIDGPTTFPQTALDLGVRLVPSGADYDTIGAAEGRVYVSQEVIGDLSAPDLVLVQSSRVEGESVAYDEMARDPQFGLLPAVTDRRVHVVDRLGYPGIEGRIRLVEDLAALLAS